MRQPPKLLKIVAGQIFDPRSLDFKTNQLITVSEETGLIHDVESLGSAHYNMDFSDPSVIDLRGKTVLPGFVDTHVHMFLHPYADVPWEDQLTKENIIERTVRATNHARDTLLAGYTTVRDLGTEGAGDADITFRKCVSGPNALIPGPRYYTANRAIVTTGSYGPKGNLILNQEGVEGVTGADSADGPDECRKVVRRQIGAGADWIKIYGDYRYRSRLAGVAIKPGSDAIRTFADDELKAIIDTAHSCGAKVAVHASRNDSISSAVRAGVDSVEHVHGFGAGLSDDTLDAELDKLASSKTIFVPTLSVYYTMDHSGQRWQSAERLFKAMVKRGVKLACGGDTGPFPHGQNALELKLMVRLGAPYKHVLRWATLGGWECVRSLSWEDPERIKRIPRMEETRKAVGDNEMPFGVLEKGWSADIIATDGDFVRDFEGTVSPEHICFVMKCGVVYKRG